MTMQFDPEIQVIVDVLALLPNPVTLNRRVEEYNGREYDEIIYVNPAFTDSLGYQQKDIPTDNDWFQQAYLDSDYKAFIFNEWFAALAKAKKENSNLLGIPAEVTCKDGSTKWFQVTTHIEPTIVKQYHCIVFVEIDTPEANILALQHNSQQLLHKNQQLEKNEHLLSEVEALAHLGSWELDLKTGNSVLSKEAYNIFREDPATFLPSLDNFFARLSQEAENKGKELLKQVIESAIIERQVLEITRGDSTQGVVELYGRAVYERDQAVRLIGSVRDITKQFELEKQNQELANVLKVAAQELFVYDLEKHGFVYVNNQACVNSGYSEQELLNLPVIELNHEVDQSYLDNIFSCLAENSIYTSSSTHHRKDGSSYPVHGTIQLIEFHNRKCLAVFCSDISELKAYENTVVEQQNLLTRQANYDLLTGLPNRFLLNDRLQQVIKQSNRYQQQFALCIIDLDQFKKINDAMGHSIGDQVIKQMAEKLSTVLRDSDTLARLGGDEFTIVLEDVRHLNDISSLAQKLVLAAKEPIVVDEQIFYMSCSVGISVFPRDGHTPEMLLRSADAAMYRAKEQGRDNFQFYTEDMTTSAAEHVNMQASLRSAIENREFVVYYQPQMNAKDNQIIGMEALVRWQHPEKGLIPPFKFVPVAEDTGMIIELDRQVMQMAMQQWSDWYQAGFNPGVLSLNLAAKQIQKPDFIDFIQQTLAKSRCKPEWIAMEITESDIMKNLDELSSVLAEISSLGISLSIDDFGTGYSSLAYLKRLPVQKLKIDRSFIKDLPADEEDAMITKTIISMAHNLGLRVIAEGVENEAQREFIVNSGCRDIQGYFYSQPIPSEQVSEYLYRYQ